MQRPGSASRLEAAPTGVPQLPESPGGHAALAARLRQRARRLGFAAIGWLQARRLHRLQQLLQALGEQGRYPAFCEKDPALRCDPERWLAGARTIIVAALPYQPPLPVAGDRPMSARGCSGGPSVRLAAYALTPDYHRQLARRLAALARWLARAGGLDPERDFRIFVDTGPPVERELLRLCGAGWVGKNTCAYVPGAGSWVLLGVVVTTLELPDAVVPDAAPPTPPDACRDCDRCVRACPVDALAPYRLDPGACIAQATQLRGPLPDNQRAALGGWVFGCDICQVVCPENWPERAPLAYFGPGRLRPLGGLSPRMPLAAILQLDGPSFQRQFGPTAASWRGKNVLQRNAAYAARRWVRHDAEGQELAARLANLAREHPSPTVRDACGWALGTQPQAGPNVPDGPIRDGPPTGSLPHPRRPAPCRTPPCAGPSPPAAGRPDH